MSFLEDFDNRAARKPGEPAPEGETPEHRELLDFADLIRARRALPEDAERQRVVDRVRAAQPASPPSPVVSPVTPPSLVGKGAGGLGLRWLSVAAAAVVGLTVGVALFSKLLAPPRGDTPIVVKSDSPEKASPEPLKFVAASTGIIGSTRPPNEEFANLEFPAPQLREGDAAAVETKAGADSARLTRVHGLVMMQAKGETRWRVCQRGQALAAGDTIRTSKRIDSSARILGPDGSAISIGSGANAIYGGPRKWALNEGRAYIEAATRKDLGEFAVSTGLGAVRALGTIFSLEVVTGADGRAVSALCWVEEGKVTITAGAATGEIVAGQSVLLDGIDHILPTDRKISKEWLAALEHVASSDHGIGQLVAKTEKANEHLPLEIKSHAVTVTVVDQVARTFVDMVFVNNSDRRLEGTFYYPLPPDASISEFAMYVGEQRIAGEVLEQHRARQIFEYIVRQQRDPALLEFAGGNLFKMRVFPIEPHSEKRVQLGYTQILPRSNGKVSYTYPLYSEMLLKNPLLDLKLEFRVISSPGLSDLSSPTHTAPVALSADGKRGALAFRAKKYSPTRDFTVTYAVPDGAECVASANLRPDDPNGYFMVQLCPKVALAPRDPPQRLLVIVDGSGGAGAQEYAVATEFAASAADVSSNWQFGVLRAGQRTASLGDMIYSNDDTSTKVRAFLQNNPPLGATDLLETFREVARAARTAGVPPALGGLQIVYVGDGIDTVSELSGPALVKEIAALFKGLDVKVSTVAVGSSYDRAVLQGIAAKLGGTFSRVEGAADVHAAVGQLFDSFYRPLLWDAMVGFEGIAVSGVYPEFIGTLAAGDTAIVVGRFAKSPAAPKGRVKLLADEGGKLIERSYDIDLTADEQSNRFLPRLWAKAHIDALLGAMGLGSPAADARTKQEIIAASINYQIMSPFTAFLVLESEENYARFGIQRKMKMWDWTPGAQNKRKARMNEQDNLGGFIPAGVDAGRTIYLGLEVDIAGGIAGDPFATAGPESATDNLNWSFDGTEAGQGLEEGERLGEKLEKAKLDDFDDKDAAGDEEFNRESLLADFDGDLDGLEVGGRGVEVLRRQRRPSEFGLIAAEETAFFRSAGRGGRYGWPHGYNYPQYSSLVFQGRTTVEIEVDQPLKSLSYYQRLAASGKGTLSTQLNLSLALEQAGRFDDALKALAPVLEKALASVDLRLQEGALRYRAGDNDGGKAAFAKALEMAAEKDRPALQERIVALLASLAQYAAAAEQYAALARAADKAELAAQRAQLAANNFQNAGKTQDAWPLWEELLKRWLNDAQVMAAAGTHAAHNGKFERGVELILAARKIDPKAGVHLITLYAQRGKKDEALVEFRAFAARAPDGNQVYGALASLSQNVATGEALAMLAEGRGAAQITGAAQYLHLYGALRTRAGVDTLAAAVQRPDFPPQARVHAINALNSARNYGRAVKLDAAKILGPLCDNPRAKEDWDLATQAINAMSAHGAHKEALEMAQKLIKRADIPDDARSAQRQAEINALNALGRHKEAEEKALRILAEATDVNAVYGPAWGVFYARLNRNEIEGAAQVAESFAQHLPDMQYRAQLQLAQRVRQLEKKDEAAALIEKLAKSYPQAPAYLDMRARMLASQGKIRDAADAVRTGIRALDAAPPLPAPAAQPTAPGTKKNEEIEAEKQKRAEKADLCRAQHHGLISLLAQLCAQDAELRAAFLKEADANAKTEDPAYREWTEAALVCLNAAGDVDGHLKRLRALVEAEPLDPLWPRRYGQALLAARKPDEARKVLEKISDAEPDDVELSLSLHDLCARMKDKQAAERHFARAFDALAKHAERLQQYAGQWQSQKPEWALKAWTHLLEKAPKSVTPDYAAYQAAQILQQLGRESEAADFYFRALLAEERGYAASAVDALVSLGQKENILRAVLPKAHKALEEKSGKRTTIYLNLLVYHLEKLRAGSSPSSSAPDSPAALARRALDAAAAAEEPAGNDCNAALRVVAALVKEGQLDRAEKFALEGGGKFSPDVRRNLIRQTAGSYFSQKKDRARAIRLMRTAVLAADDSNYEYDQQKLVELLIEDGQLAAAEADARKMQPGQNSWIVSNTWNRLAQTYQNQKNYSQAFALALDAARLLRDDSNYGDNAFSQFIYILDEALRNNAKIDDAMRKKAADLFRDGAKLHFAGETSHGSWTYNYRPGVIEKLGLRDEIARLVRDAGTSDSPKRVALAADFLWRHEHQHAEAKRLYRRALTLPDTDAKNIHSQFYQLLIQQHEKHQPEWGEALEVLAKAKELKAYDENGYLYERGRCLYGLKRADEARETYCKLLAKPAYWRNGYWSVQSLALELLNNHKDYLMAAEAWELAIKLLRRQSRGQVDAGTAANFYQSCAQAYAQLGQPEKALDSFLRGMSVVPRNDSHYQQLLDAALKHALKGQALDKAVADYEKSVTGGGGERPHLRIAFAEGFKKANDPRAMLRHLSIAADLLPKDTQLRQQVIDGYKQLADTESALAAYRDWAKFDPQNIEIYRAMGDFFQSLGRAEDALMAWATMAEVRPREAEGYRAYAQKLAQLGKQDAAAVALRHALRYRPTEFEISKELAAVYKTLKQDDRIPALWTAGETACRKAIEDFADDPLAWLNLGHFLGAQNRAKDEQDLYREILRRSWPRFQRETHDEARKRLGT